MKQKKQKKYEGNLELEELEEWFTATLMLSIVMNR